MSADRMKPGLTRRGCIAAGAALPLGAASARAEDADAAQAAPSPALPARDDFPAIEGTYLNAGSVHPFSIGARQAVQDYLASRAMSGQSDYDIAAMRRSVIAAYGRLINAGPHELAYIQSTSAGEQLAVSALGIPRSGGRIVTDALHFFGSFHLYNELERAGMEVVVVRPRDNRIHIEDLAAAVNDRTVLVAVSEVSTINGFRHDLKAVAELAHAHGAKVYVDAVHAAGATPVDVKATGVDLMASSSYKWLMGDMGLGFMYVREDLIGELERPQAGYQQLAAISSHVFPHDEPGDRVYETRARDDATGLFAMGTFSNTGVAHLGYSLNWLNTVGVETIQAWRQPMIERVRAEMPRLGFEPLSPEDSDSALIAFSMQDARERLGSRLRAAGVQAGLSQHRLRVSVGVFNDDGDIDRLLEVLS